MSDTNVVYSAIFNAFTSWDFASEFEGRTLGQFMQRLNDSHEEGTDAKATRTYEILSDALERYPELADTRIMGQSWNQGGRYNSETAACVFETPSGDIYVSYRGTGDGGWIDNGQGVTAESTQQQEEAARYFDDMAERYGWTRAENIIVTGHSKGGNKAQYVTMMAENGELIDCCYSMDGQGFSDDAIRSFQEKYGEQGYQEILEKMYAINGYNDYVSPLINPIIPSDHTTWLGTTENPDGGMGGQYAGFHMIEMYFQMEDGEFTALLATSTEQGPIGELAVQLSRYLMSLPEEERDAAAMVIMQILEAATGGSSVGIDGDMVSIDDIFSFSTENLVPVLAQVIFSESGRQVIKDLISRIGETSGWHPAIIGTLLIVLAPFAVATTVVFVSYMELTERIVDIIRALGEAFQKASERLKKFMDIIRDSGEIFARWLQSIRGTEDSRYFRVDITRLRHAQSELRTERLRIEQAARRIRAIRRNIDFGLLIRQSLYFRLVSATRALDQRAEAMERLEDTIEKCIWYYERSERAVVAHYEAACF